MHFIVGLFHTTRRACCIVALGFTVSVFAQGTPPISQYFPDFVTSNATPWLQPDGRVVYAGGAGNRYAMHALAVVRFNADGTPDHTFGTGGMVRLTALGATESANVVIGQVDGKLLVGGNVIDPASQCYLPYFECRSFIAMFRVHVDGSRDVNFNGNGRLLLSVYEANSDGDYDQFLSGLVAQTDGSIELVSFDAVVARVLAGGQVHPRLGDYFAHEVKGTFAIDFYNRRLDHFFVSADVSEIATLNRDPATGWQWAGGGFNVHPAGSSAVNTVPVCRFYGLPEAGPDSHFISANAAECASLESAGGAKWVLESREVFRVELPDPVTGECAVGRSARVFRLWNGRADSNHHFTTSKALRDRFVAASGYVAEGWGQHGVAMCATR